MTIVKCYLPAITAHQMIGDGRDYIVTNLYKYTKPEKLIVTEITEDFLLKELNNNYITYSEIPDFNYVAVICNGIFYRIRKNIFHKFVKNKQIITISANMNEDKFSNDIWYDKRVVLPLYYHSFMMYRNRYNSVLYYMALRDIYLDNNNRFVDMFTTKKVEPQLTYNCSTYYGIDEYYSVNDDYVFGARDGVKTGIMFHTSNFKLSRSFITAKIKYLPKQYPATLTNYNTHLKARPVLDDVIYGSIDVDRIFEEKSCMGAKPSYIEDAVSTSITNILGGQINKRLYGYYNGNCCKRIANQLINCEEFKEKVKNIKEYFESSTKNDRLFMFMITTNDKMKFSTNVPKNTSLNSCEDLTMEESIKQTKEMFKYIDSGKAICFDSYTGPFNTFAKYVVPENFVKSVDPSKVSISLDNDCVLVIKNHKKTAKIYFYNYEILEKVLKGFIPLLSQEHIDEMLTKYILLKK